MRGIRERVGWEVKSTYTRYFLYPWSEQQGEAQEWTEMEHMGNRNGIKEYCKEHLWTRNDELIELH